MAKDKIPEEPQMPHPGHERHLCFLANLGYQMQYTKAYKALVRDGKFVCNGCGRIAADRQSLCKPTKI
ncbi:MAG: hypothetical protein ACYTEL_18765 [Planctomycetota bacterium]|jgi:hypothetical protein